MTKYLIKLPTVSTKQETQKKIWVALLQENLIILNPHTLHVNSMTRETLIVFIGLFFSWLLLSSYYVEAFFTFKYFLGVKLENFSCYELWNVFGSYFFNTLQEYSSTFDSFNYLQFSLLSNWEKNFSRFSLNGKYLPQALDGYEHIRWYFKGIEVTWCSVGTPSAPCQFFM